MKSRTAARYSSSANAAVPPRTFAQKRLALVIGLTLGVMAATPAAANPQGAQVVNGAATFSQPDATTLEVTNTPNAIINWQQFNIGANETTRFIQQSATSAVMNRVVGLNPSEILGQLQSNGRVYLINPNGIVFGHGAVVDTAAFIGATLNMTDADFLAGRHNFEGPEGAGGITNHGVIKARDDGGVYLVAPEIENDGIIRTDEGQILLAAGRKLTISSLDVAHISFEVQAPEDSVVNLGELLTAGGAASVFASSIRNSGRIRASGISRDAQGRIVLNAGREGNIELTASSEVSASRGDTGGTIVIDGGRSLKVSGKVAAVGAQGTGGQIDMTADTVTVDNAVVDASGDTGGGTIRIGGEYQGGKHLLEDEMRNAANLTITPTGEVRAEATGRDGDGGEVVIWSDQVTGFLGEVYARPGEASGAGGSVEVSGREFLVFRGSVESGRGERHGHLLLDPKDIVIATGGGDDPANATFGVSPGSTFTIDPNTLSTLLGLQNVSLQANNDITVTNDVSVGSGPANDLTMQAGRGFNLNANLSFIAANNVTITANERLGAGVVDGERDAGAGGITMAPGTSITTPGDVRLIIEDDVTKTNNTSGSMALGDISANHVELLMKGSTDDGDIFSLAGTSIVASSVFVDHFPNAGGALGSNGDIGTAAQPLRLDVTNFAGHMHHAGEMHVELLNQGTTTLGDTFFGNGAGITGIESGADQGGGDVSITSVGSIEVVDDIRVRGGSLFLEAGSDGTGSLTVDMDAAVGIGSPAIATTPDVVDIVVGTGAGDSGTMTVDVGEGLSLIGADGVDSFVSFDVFGSGAQTFTVGTDFEALAGNGGGVSTFNVRTGLGGTGANGGGQQSFDIGSDLRISSALGDNPLDVDVSATNGRQVFQVANDISLAAGTDDDSVIEILGAGTVTGGLHQDFQVNFAQAASAGQFTVDTGIGGVTGGTDNKVNVSATGAQSVDLRGPNSGLAIKGDSLTADPANFFARLDAGGDQTIAIEGDGNLFMGAGQASALLTSGGAQTITVSDGGVNLQPLTGADKETRIEGATQTINADFMQVFGGDNDPGADAIVRSQGNQTINITTAGGQTFTMRGGIAGATAGQALLDVAGALTITNALGNVLIGDAGQSAPALLSTGSLNLTGQDISFSGGDQSNAVARATAGGNAVLNASGTISLTAGSANFAQATVSPSGDLDVQATTDILMSGGTGSATTATFSGATISRFDAGGNLTMTAGSGSGTGGAVVFATTGVLDTDIVGNVVITGGGVGTSSAQARMSAQGNIDASFGTLSLDAGAGTDGDVLFESLAGQIDLTTTGNVDLDAGVGGTGSEVNLEGATGLTAVVGGSLSLSGGPSQDAAADMGAAAGTADITSGALTLTGGNGLDAVASLFAETGTLLIDVTGPVTLNGGGGVGAKVGFAGPVVSVDATSGVTMNGGAGDAAEAIIGSLDSGATVSVNATGPGADIAISPGGGTGARAYIGTGCTVGPCDAAVTLSADDRIDLFGGAADDAFLGSATASNGDVGGSITVTALNGSIGFNAHSAFTPGAIVLTAGTLVGQNAGGGAGLRGASLTINSATGVFLSRTTNDVGSASFTTTGTGNVTYANNATLEIGNGDSLTVNTVNIADGDFTLSNTGATVLNGTIAPGGLSGAVSVTVGSPLTVNAPISGRNGVFLQANAGALDGDIVLNSPIDSLAGAVTVTADDQVSIQGSITALSSSIDVTSNNADINGPGLLSASSVSLLAPNGSVGDLGTMFIDALGLGLSAIGAVDISIENNPPLTLPGLTLSDRLNVASDGSINQGLGTGDELIVGGSASFTARDGNISLTNTNNSFGGTVALSAFGSRGPAAASVSGSGPLILGGGALPETVTFNFGGGVVNNGELSFRDGTTFNAGPNFVNNGVIRFGDSPGTLTITGNMTLGASSVLEIELSALDVNPADDFPDHDQLIVTGTLTLGGELEIQPIDGFTGDPDVTFDIIQCGSCVGDFDLVTAFPAIVTVESFPGATLFSVVTTSSDASLDPTSDILADLDALEDLEALEEELLEAELELALGDEGDEEDDEDEGVSGALICL